MLNKNLASRIQSIDWDYAGSASQSPFSAIHWHPCRIVSQIPASLIGLLTRKGEVVLDPFAGSGTVLVEAQRLGRPAIGIELNPVACLMARAKTLRVRHEGILADVEAIQNIITDSLFVERPPQKAPSAMTLVPTGVQLEKWYTRNVQEQLGFLWERIAILRGRKKLLAQAAFSAILLKVCRETRHWGYVCDNVTPQSSREALPLAAICDSLDKFSLAYAARDEFVFREDRISGPIPPVNILQGDARILSGRIPDNSVSLVLTSPPYFGVCDYIKAQRLSMEWFEHDIEPLRLTEIGARSKRHRQAAVDDYLSELGQVFAEVPRCLKAGGHLALIIGESDRRRGVVEEVKSVLERTGFIFELEKRRNISVQRRQAPSLLTERLLIMRHK